MQLLTKLYNKFQTNQELSCEELKFLYEIDNNIQGFGYEKDPRINEIIKYRNKRKDLANIFSCSLEEIGIAPESIKEKKLSIIMVI